MIFASYGDLILGDGGEGVVVARGTHSGGRCNSGSEPDLLNKVSILPTTLDLGKKCAVRGYPGSDNPLHRVRLRRRAHRWATVT